MRKLYYFIAGLMLVTVLNAQVTRRIYLIGNSVTDGINYAGFATMALELGNTHVWGRKMIPGAPLSLLWDARNDDGFTESPFFAPSKAFVNYEWDCISLQPFDRGIEGTDGDKLMTKNFIDLAKGKSPNVQFYLYSRYPRKPQGVSVFDADLWEKLWLGTFTGVYQTNETQKYFEDLVKAVRTDNPDVKPALLVPVGDVMFAMNKKAKEGKTKGMSSAWDLYSDGIHVNNIGSYLIMATFYATMYKEDVRQTPVPYSYGSIDPELRDTIQQTIFEVVFNHAYSGVSSADLVGAASVSVSPSNLSLTVLQSKLLVATVLPNNAANKKVSWTSSNTAIATVSPTGLVTGVSAGSCEITAKTNDGGFTAKSDVTVTGSISGDLQTGILAAWEFQSNALEDNIPASTSITGITTTSPSLIASRGEGLCHSGFIGNGFYGGCQTTNTLTAAIAGNEYFSFKISPDAGKLISINKIKYNAVSQNQDRYFALFSNLTGFSVSTIIKLDSSGFGKSIEVPITGMNNITEPLEFRVYLYGADNPYEAAGIGNGTGNDFVIEGSILTPSDNEAPSKPSNLLTSQVKDVSLTLSWDESTDNMVVFGYNVFMNNNKINTSLVKENSFVVSGLTSGVSYSFTVKALDFLGNESVASDAHIVMTNRAPTAVITASPESGPAPLTVSLNSNASTDPDQDDYILGFDWDFGDNSPHDYANNITHTYTQQGTYIITLKVMDNRNMYSTAVNKTIIVGPLNINEESENMISIYPNPADNLIFIENVKGQASIEVMNAQGAIVLTKSIQGNDKIDVSEWLNGLYIFNVKNDNCNLIEKVIVK